MSEIQSESHTASISQPESQSKDSIPSDVIGKTDINSNTPFDLTHPTPTTTTRLKSLTNSKDEDDEEFIEEGDSRHRRHSFSDDGTCSRSRPYVRGQNKPDHEVFVSRSLLPSLSSPEICLKAKESLAVLDKLVLMPTPPEDSDLPALLPKDATPSDPPAEKCEVVEVVVPVLTSESPRSPGSPEDPSSPQNKSPSGTLQDQKNPVGVNTVHPKSPPPPPPPKITPNKTKEEEEEDDSPNFPRQEKKETFSGSPKERKTNTSVYPVSPEVCSPDCPEKSPPIPTDTPKCPKNNTSAPSSVTVSIYPTSRKGSNIPVGIAVAWQRLVTSTSSTSSTTLTPPTTTIMSSVGVPGVQKDANSIKVRPEPPPSPVNKIPLRPSSASPVGRLKSNKSPSSVHTVKVKSGSDKRPMISHHHPFRVEGKSLTPDLSSYSSPPSPFPLTRPLPSSSVPPNLGLPYHSTSSAVDSFYGGMRSSTPFSSVNTQHPLHPHFPSWPSTPGTDLSPQAFLGASPYLQSQQSMQNQMHLHHQMTHHHSSYTNFYSSASSASSYMHSGLDVFRHHYEQVLLQSQQQQQQVEFLRQYQHHHQIQQQQQQQQLHHHQQQQLLLSPNGSSSDSLRATPGRTSIPPTLSPGNTRSPNAFLNPSQLGNHSSVSNLSSTTGTTGTGGVHPNWPLETYHHHNSSTTLSPKSLTSSTPSPSESGRKCPSPYPHNKTFPLNSPQQHVKDHHDASLKREHMSMSRDPTWDDPQGRSHQKTPSDNVDNHNVRTHTLSNACRPAVTADRFKTDASLGSPLSSTSSPSPSHHRHDFTRMESLIEKPSEDAKEDTDVPTSTTNPNLSPCVNTQEKGDKRKPQPSDSPTLTETGPTNGTNLNDISPVKMKGPNLSGKKVEKAHMIVKSHNGTTGNNLSLAQEKKLKRRNSDNSDSPTEERKNKKLSDDFPPSPRKKGVKRLQERRPSNSGGSSSSVKRENYKKTKVPDLQLPVAAAAPTSPASNSGRHLHKKPVQSEPICVRTLSPIKDAESFTPKLKCSSSNSTTTPQSYSSSISSNTDNPKSSNSQLNLRTYYSSDLATNDNSNKKNGNKEEQHNNSRTNSIYATETNGGDGLNKNAITPNQNPVNPSPVIISTKSHVISTLNPIPGESKLLSPPILPNSPVTLILPRLVSPTVTTTTNKIPTPTSPPTLHTSFKVLLTSQEIKLPQSFLPQLNPKPKGIPHQLVEHGTILQNVNLVASTLSSSILSSPPQSSSSSSLNVTPCDSESINNSNIISPPFPTGESPSSSRPYLNGSGSLSSSSSPSATTRLSLPNVCTEIRRASWGGSAQNSICVQKEFREDNHLDLLATVAQEFGSRDDLGKLVGSCGPNFLSPSNSSIASGSSRGSSLMPSPVHSSMQSPEGPAVLLSSIHSYSSQSTGSTGSTYCKSEPSSSLPTSPVPMNRLPPTLNPECSQYKERPSKNHNHHHHNQHTKKSPTQNDPNAKPHVWLKIPHVIPKAAAKVAEKVSKKKAERKKKSDESTRTSSPPNGTRDPSKDPLNSRPNANNAKVDSPNLITKDSHKHSSSSKSHSSQDLIPKLRIPKISQSIVNQATRRNEGQPSKEKPLKASKKVSSKATESSSSTTQHSKHTNHSDKSVKLKLPVPKVAKLRIKLSETANPILMKDRQSSESSSSASAVKVNKKHKIKRRHSDGDKLSRKKKLQVPSDLSTDHPTSSSSFPKEKTTKKRKHSSPHDSFSYGNESSCKKKSAKKATKIEILPSPHDLSQSFTSLTPPPTAKLLKDSPLNEQEQTEGKQLKNNQLQTTTSNKNPFSPFHLKHELGETSTSETEENEPGESEPNWVSDPTFAASAIRLTSTTTATTTSSHDQTLLGDNNKPEGYSFKDTHTFTNGKKELTNTRETSEDSTPQISSSLSFRHHSLDTKKQTHHGDDDDESSSSSSDSDEEAIHFPSKRVKAGASSSATATTTGGNNRVHIKPCLKAQPVVRPFSSLSSSSPDSDEDIDLEVATLTNSISHKSFRSPYANNNKSNFTSKYSSSVTQSSTATEFPTSNVSPIRPSYVNNNNHHQQKVVPSSTVTTTTLSSSNRRLSMNVELGRSDEEELLDIPEDFPPPTLKPKSTTQPIKIRRFSQSSEYDDKSKRLPSKSVLKGTHRSTSLSSSPTSSLFASSRQPKNPNSAKSPRKRSSRSSTTTSSIHSAIISSSSSPVSNKSTPAAGIFAPTPTSSSTGAETKKAKADVVEDETLIPGNIQLESVSELLDEMRILTEIQGLFYTGKLNALQPPDVYGVTLDNERGAPPHLIFSAEEVLEKCIREKKPQTLTVGLRICAYWSPQYSGLYPGRVSTDFNPAFDPEHDLIPIEFDDGDTGMIKLAEIRLLPKEHPIREYDPNPLLTLEKKHRKRRHSSANTNSGRCTGDHEEADCGESFCAKVSKYEEEDEEDDEEFKDNKPRSFKSMYWTWTGLGYKRPKSKKNRNKEFFRGIQRGDEIINVGDSAIFISHGNERPYIGRVEKFWEKKGQKVVTVRWFYHPEEVKSPKRIPHLKHPGALFESPHIDENDVQTIGRKCDVLPFPEFKERIGKMPKLSLKNSNTTKPKDLYYVAGYYDPYTYNLKLKI